MHAQLSDIVSAFVAARDHVHRVCDALPDARWGARPAPRAWSVAECVVHLNLTGRAYLPILRDGLDEARARGGGAPTRYRRSVMGWLIGMAAGPAPRLGGRRVGRVATRAAFVPREVPDRRTVLAEFDALQAEQIALTRAGDGLPLDRVRVTSPIDARVRYDLYACLVLLPRHQRRHLEQMEDVVAALGGSGRGARG